MVSEGYDAADLSRWIPEPMKAAQRTPFQRDRARILHSSALRRLGQKTQVLGAGTEDFARTRLTHSLEVAQIGRELGMALGCDPDVVDAACLAHDLGHPPFGHNGEAALNVVADDIGGFEGNAQTLRLLTRLEPKSYHPRTGETVGLNLTRAVLDASVKYPWRRHEAEEAMGRPSNKFGVYEDDREIFDWLRAGAPRFEKSFEAQVMDLADDISYSVHDVEDSVVTTGTGLDMLADPGRRRELLEQAHTWMGDFDEDEFGQALERLQRFEWWSASFDGTHRSLAAIKDMTSQLIGRLATSAIGATRQEFGTGALTRHHARLVVPPETKAEIRVLKAIAVHLLMAPRESSPMYVEQRSMLTQLVDEISAGGAAVLEPWLLEFYERAEDDDARRRVAIDQVASLTDASARVWHGRLTSID